MSSIKRAFATNRHYQSLVIGSESVSSAPATESATSGRWDHDRTTRDKKHEEEKPDGSVNCSSEGHGHGSGSEYRHH